MKDNSRTSGIGIADCNFMDSNFFEWKIRQEIQDLEVRLNDICDKIYVLSKRKSIESDPVKKDRMNRKMEKLYHVRDTIGKRIRICQEHLNQLKETGSFFE
jgi:hypothetical protein